MTENEPKLPSAATEADDDTDLTLDDLLKRLGDEPSPAPVSSPAPGSGQTVDDDVLSEQDIETLKGLLDINGKNPEIEAILEDDRRRNGEWKRRRMARRCGPPVVAPATARMSASVEPPSAVSVPVAPVAKTNDPATRTFETGTDSTTGPRALPAAMLLPDAAELERAVAAVRARDSVRLRAELEKLVDSLHPHSTTRKAHAEVRRWIWAINAVLTERDEIAPCARAQPEIGRFIGKGMRYSEDEALMLNDRQIFDLAYLHKHRWGKPVKKWHALLRSEVFDPALAARFVTTVGKVEAKVKALGLRPEEMMLLAVIRTDAVRKRWERIEADAERLEDLLRGVAGMLGSKVPDERVPLWCEEYVGLVIAKGSPAKTHVLLPRLFGRTRPANQLANRKLDLAKKGFKVG